MSGGERTGDGTVVEKQASRVKPPPMYQVVLLNDDYTPMEFVVAVLEQVFRKSPAEATQLMLTIHRSGLGVAGVYVLELAETKVVAVHRMAEERGFPLRAGVEKE
jgi:ATP-dependent Clp protease adaptor protein ClpS